MRTVITKEMLTKIHTDSDVEDLAEELNISLRELDWVLANYMARNTPCYGCTNIAFINSVHCRTCSRGKTDNFIQEDLSKLNIIVEE